MATKDATTPTEPPKDGNVEEELPSEIINRLIGLKQLQEEYESLDDQYKEERIALEKKYHDLRNPILTKRAEVLSGNIDVEVETEGATPAAASSTRVKGVPGFWLQCIANHPAISSLLGETDGQALEALQDIKVEYNEDYSAFKLIFVFAPNDYFTNETLTKSYTVNPDLLDETAPALTSVDGTVINWKDKKNLCEMETKKKQKSKKKGQTRIITQMTPVQSFFHFFGDPHMGDDDEEEEDEEGGGGESQKKHEFQLSVDADYEIGHMFRTEIIPSAILWFTGEADGGIDLDDDEEDGEDDEDDEGEEEEDDDEDPAEESEEVDAGNKGKSRKGKGGAGAGAGAGTAGPGTGAAGEQPECKQS